MLQLNECCWFIDEITKLRKKGLGTGVMVSAFLDRGYGMGGPTLTDAQLEAINKKREKKKYADEEAAMFLFGTTEKQKLTSTPFIRYLNHGTEDGYWTYRHTVIQIEDCM